MSKKKATPKKEAATITKAKPNTVCSLGNYEKRCLESLIIGSCERSNLDQFIGTTNSPEYIRQLRAKGLKIITHKARGFNRDGRKIWWGEYSLDAGSLAKAKGLLGVE